jgi:hypothetical protein
MGIDWKLCAWMCALVAGGVAAVFIVGWVLG